jgi:hypothetical protein
MGVVDDPKRRALPQDGLQVPRDLRDRPSLNALDGWAVDLRHGEQPGWVVVLDGLLVEG